MGNDYNEFSSVRVTFAAFTATAFASMWISSHVATALTLPILVSLLKSLEDVSSGHLLFEGSV
jgi:di/tricarboxylate transporter